MTERTRIIDVSERRAFRTIYEAINWCVGTDYKYWGKACWPSMCPAYGFRLWFTQLAHVEHGRYVPSVNKYINILCCNLIFSKDVGGYYYFRGIFIIDYEHSGPNHRVSKRVATRARLIGCPATRLELLNTIESGEFDEDYLKKHIVSSDVVDDGHGYVSNSNRSGNAVLFKPIQKKALVEKVKISDEEGARLFPVNSRIYHHSFGFGKVKSIEDGKFTIVFDKSGTKELSIDFCIQNKLIEKK